MCDRPCESGGSVVDAEDGSTAVLGVLESVQPLRKAGSVGMQRTGLMHVGWWEGVLSVLANIKADYLRRPPSERRQPEIWLKNHLCGQPTRNTTRGQASTMSGSLQRARVSAR